MKQRIPKSVPFDGFFLAEKNAFPELENIPPLVLYKVTIFHDHSILSIRCTSIILSKKVSTIFIFVCFAGMPSFTQIA